MQKRISLLFILLILFPLISAVQIDLKSEYAQAETLIAKISGNFVDPILDENVIFYRGHVRVPIDFSILKLEGNYYLYAQLPENPSNYTLTIRGIRYYKITQITDEDFSKNFTITSAVAQFKVDPGFIITNKDFSIELQNLQSNEINVGLKITNSSEGISEGFFDSLFSSSSELDTYTLSSGEIKQINFEVSNIENSELRFIKLKSENLTYDIPVYLYANDSELETENSETFKFSPTDLEISMPTESQTDRTIYLKNTGEENLGNITLSFSNSLEKFVSVDIENISSLEKDEELQMKLIFISDIAEREISGKLKAKTENYSTSLDIDLNIIYDYIPSNDSNTIEKYCEKDLGGQFCEDDEECSIETTPAFDGYCCLGECGEKLPGSTSKILGWFLLIIVIFVVLWFVKSRYFGASK